MQWINGQDVRWLWSSLSHWLGEETYLRSYSSLKADVKLSTQPQVFRGQHSWVMGPVIQLAQKYPLEMQNKSRQRKTLFVLSWVFKKTCRFPKTVIQRKKQRMPNVHWVLTVRESQVYIKNDFKNLFSVSYTYEKSYYWFLTEFELVFR